MEEEDEWQAKQMRGRRFRQTKIVRKIVKSGRRKNKKGARIATNAGLADFNRHKNKFIIPKDRWVFKVRYIPQLGGWRRLVPSGNLRKVWGAQTFAFTRGGKKKGVRHPETDGGRLKGGGDLLSHFTQYHRRGRA